MCMESPKTTQSCLTLCDPKDCTLPGSSGHGILQARTLEWVAIPFSRNQDLASHFTSFHLIFATTAAKSLQSCPTLCNPVDGSPPGSSVLGILQARTLEWVAIAFSNA